MTARIKVKWLSIQRKTIDPLDMPDGDLELWSIPDFDNGSPSITNRQSIGSSKKVVFPGDVLLSKIVPHIRRAWIVRESNLPQYASTEWLTFHSSKVRPEFLRYALLTDEFNRQMQLNSNGMGSLKRADPEKVGEQQINLPTIRKQKIIADFLDKRLVAIDAVLHQKSEQLKKLSTYRQSLITRAVTKGLDPNVEMKDSGYDIANNIPIHWVTIKLQYLCKLATGNQDTQDAVPDGQYPFYVRSPTIERTNLVTYSGTGILIAGDGVGAGKVFHYAEGQYGIHQRVYLLSEISDLIDPKYLFFYIKTIFSCEVERGTAKSTVPSIRMPMLTRFLVCVPPKREQIEIRDYCQKVEEKTEAISEDIKNNIRLLKEYRSSLISAAVTGQLAIDEEASA